MVKVSVVLMVAGVIEEPIDVVVLVVPGVLVMVGVGVGMVEG